MRLTFCLYVQFLDFLVNSWIPWTTKPIITNNSDCEELGHCRVATWRLPYCLQHLDTQFSRIRVVPEDRSVTSPWRFETYVVTFTWRSATWRAVSKTPWRKRGVASSSRKMLNMQRKRMIYKIKTVNMNTVVQVRLKDTLQCEACSWMSLSQAVRTVQKGQSILCTESANSCLCCKFAMNQRSWH